MVLSGEQLKELHEAMLSAFPETNDLKIMVRFQLEKRLHAIAGGNNLYEIVFDLIERADSEGWLKDLVNKAYEYNSGNQKLKEFVEKFSAVFSANSQTSSKASQPNESHAEVSASTQNPTFQPSPATNRTFLHPWGTVVPHFHSINVPLQEAPPDLKLPDGYQYLGKLEGLSTEHLYREQDGHIVILVPAQSDYSKPFLIDKYAITAQQFCFFLNELIDNKIVQVESAQSSGVKCAVDEQGRTLALDALDQWQYSSTKQYPAYLYAAPPWGMTYQNYTWQPVADSELLPATLISWLGARLYSLWAHRKFSSFAIENANYLPTLRQWEIVCVQDILTQRQLRYPWGETWQRDRVNYAGYWTGCEVTEADWKKLWTNQADIYSQTRPLPVTSLNEGRSPIGCVQMLGNVWEWCADNPGAYETSNAVRGGSCLSFKENCDAKSFTTRRPGQSSEYIGFRCCFPLKV